MEVLKAFYLFQIQQNTFYFIFKGDYSTVCSRRPSTDPSSSHGNTSGERDKNEDCDIQGGRLTVFVHKRSDQLSQEITQAILR